MPLRLQPIFILAVLTLHVFGVRRRTDDDVQIMVTSQSFIGANRSGKSTAVSNDTDLDTATNQRSQGIWMVPVYSAMLHYVGDMQEKLIHHMSAELMEKWYALDVDGWVAMGVGFRYLEMALWSISRVMLSRPKHSMMSVQCEAKKDNGARAGWNYNLHDKLFESAKEIRRYRVYMEGCYTQKRRLSNEYNKSNPKNGLGNALSVKNADYYLNTVKFRMQCAKQKLTSHPLRNTITILTSILEQYAGRSKVAPMGVDILRHRDSIFPDRQPSPCRDQASWAMGQWAMRSAAGGNFGQFWTIDKMWQPMLWYTNWKMGTADGKHEWRVLCSKSGDPASMISIDEGRTWYSWSGFQNIYYSDFADPRRGGAMWTYLRHN